MTDIKRDFLYQFNGCLNNIYSDKPSIVSVFENIDSGILKLSPAELADADFIEKVGKCIYVIKRIASNPYMVVNRKQEVVPVSQAQNINHESVKLTTLDASLWAKKGGEFLPKNAYSLVSEDVFINYENAFIYQLIKMLLIRLRSIKSKTANALGINSSDDATALAGVAPEQLELYNRICSYIRKLDRLSNEKVFSDNSNRAVDMTQIFVTDILATEKRYNYCYKFFYKEFRNKKNANVITDFRVLYHNFAIIQLMYNLYKSGYSVKDTDYHIAATGKMFVGAVEFEGEKKLSLSQSKNGVDITVSDKIYHVEFSKSMLKTANEIEEDYNKKANTLNKNGKYEKVYVAYLSSEEQAVDGALSIGYKNVSDTINRLIKAL